MTAALESHALISDCETAALICADGSIDWLCLPRFDSPACCAALLGSPENGQWGIAPDGPLRRSEQRYRPDTMIVETDLYAADGAIRVTDFMPIRADRPTLIRRVTGLAGRVTATMNAAFCFDDGHMPPWVTAVKGGAVMHVGPDKVMLRSGTELAIEHDTIRARFVVDADSRLDFVLVYGAGHEADPPPVDVERALADTERFWRDWANRFKLKIEHAEALRRSLLTLKALIHGPTGGLVAAPTTSLPEKPGGAMNWDYRYCWLRDSTFTVGALLGCGYTEEASAWRDWLLRAVAGAPEMMQIMYRVDGGRRVDERELPWLTGYRFARPVRVGNAAAGQLQLDVYGEVVNTLHACERAGLKPTPQGRQVERAIVDHVERVWAQPDQGLWESRGEPRCYTYSKVMTWVAVDRFLDGGASDELTQSERRHFESLRERIHAVICSEGFDAGLGSFTSFFGGHGVDASLLLLPKMGFLPADDERMVGTISRIEKELVSDGLIYRSAPEDDNHEGAFLACSCWLAECQLGQRRRADAVATIERVLAVRSPTGLLAEEYDIASRRLCGNYPQALSHLALIHALLALARFDDPDTPAGKAQHRSSKKTKGLLTGDGVGTPSIAGTPAGRLRT